MVTEEKVKEAWHQYHQYRDDMFGRPGNGCDDYRDYPDEVYITMRKLKDNAHKLQKEYDESQY